jgi:hypothetical protein
MQLSLEGARIASLMGALCAEEITTGEVSECLQSLSLEAIGVFTASLNGLMVFAEVPDPRLVAARGAALSVSAWRGSRPSDCHLAHC